ncbi:prolipoprotein diacylglyceryl transferase [Patescibacteria group bacterium]
MIPTLVRLGPVTITSLGVMIVLGFILGSFLIWKKTKEENFDEEKAMDAIIVTTVFAFLVSRSLFVLFYFSEMGGNLLSWFDFVGKPGFSWIGALLGGIVSLVLFCKKHKWDFYKVADLFSFGLVLFAIFLHIGTFLDGSFYGTATSMPWGIKFIGLDGPRHPTQLYELIFMVILLKLLYFFDKNYRTYEWYKNKRGEALAGFLLAVFLAGFSLTKFMVGFFKEHDLYWMLWQALTLLVFLVSLGIIYFRSGKSVDITLPRLPSFNLSYPTLKKRKKPKPKFRYKKGVDAK